MAALIVIFSNSTGVHLLQCPSWPGELLVTGTFFSGVKSPLRNKQTELKKQAAVTYSTARENKVIKIFFTSPGH